MTGQVDVGWSVAPFILDPLEKGETRLIASASEIERIRGQTIRVMIINARNLGPRRMPSCATCGAITRPSTGCIPTPTW